MTNTALNLDGGNDELLRRFLDTTIDPHSFDHVAHVRVAWSLLNQMPYSGALEAMDSGLRRLVAKHGISGKFHVTITEAMMRLISDRMRAGQTWDVFIRTNGDLQDNARDLLDRYYSPERLMSEAARNAFVTPDRLPLPVPGVSPKTA